MKPNGTELDSDSVARLERPCQASQRHCATFRADPKAIDHQRPTRGRNVDFIADTDRNPFGMEPPCEQYVPGYGDTGAHFHVVGDTPTVHGGLDTGIPFTDRPWTETFFDTLDRAGLVEQVDLTAGVLELDKTFLSYLHMCDPGEEAPTNADYAALEPFFDAELRAITAHVLLPVGARATAHVLDTYTARSSDGLDMEAIHATEIRGSGWLVLPIRDPAEWTDGGSRNDGSQDSSDSLFVGDAERLVDALQTLQERDYRRTSDLGRFLADDESYLVR